MVGTYRFRGCAIYTSWLRNQFSGLGVLLAEIHAGGPATSLFHLNIKQFWRKPKYPFGAFSIPAASLGSRRQQPAPSLHRCLEADGKPSNN